MAKRTYISRDVLIAGNLDVARDTNSGQLTDVTKISVNHAKSQILSAQVTGILDELEDIASDNVITPTEKLVVLREWENIEYEKPFIDDYADNAGAGSPGTLWSAFNTAYINLDNYLNPDILGDLTVPTNIAGSALRNAFSNYYEAKSALLAYIEGLRTLQIGATAIRPNICPDFGAEYSNDGSAYGYKNVEIPTEFWRTGDTVIISGELQVDAAAQAGGVISRVYLYSTDPGWQASTVLQSVSTTWEFKESTLTIPSGATGLRVGAYHYPNGNSAGTVYCRRIKVEIVNPDGIVKATLFVPYAATEADLATIREHSVLDSMQNIADHYGYETYQDFIDSLDGKTLFDPQTGYLNIEFIDVATIIADNAVVVQGGLDTVVDNMETYAQNQASSAQTAAEDHADTVAAAAQTAAEDHADSVAGAARTNAVDDALLEMAQRYGYSTYAEFITALNGRYIFDSVTGYLNMSVIDVGTLAALQAFIDALYVKHLAAAEGKLGSFLGVKDTDSSENWSAGTAWSIIWNAIDSSDRGYNIIAPVHGTYNGVEISGIQMYEISGTYHLRIFTTDFYPQWSYTGTLSSTIPYTLHIEFWWRHSVIQSSLYLNGFLEVLGYIKNQGGAEIMYGGAGLVVGNNYPAFERRGPFFSRGQVVVKRTTPTGNVTINISGAPSFSGATAWASALDWLNSRYSIEYCSILASGSILTGSYTTGLNAMSELVIGLNHYGSTWYFVASDDSTRSFYQQVSTPGGLQYATGVIVFI